MSGIVNKGLSHHTYRFPEFLLLILCFFRRQSNSSPNRFILQWKISYLNLLFPFVFDLY